jgi:hypothetical protein
MAEYRVLNPMFHYNSLNTLQLEEDVRVLSVSVTAKRCLSIRFDPGVGPPRTVWLAAKP